MMKDIDSGVRSEAADDGRQSDEPQIVVVDQTAIYCERCQTALIRSEISVDRTVVGVSEQKV